jgi:uncharacterized protein (TIGR02246 family)
VAEDQAAIRAIGAEWKAAYAAGRLTDIPELYTADTVVMPRGRPRIEGREALRRSIGGLASGRRVDIDLTEREIVVAGDHAWMVTDFRVTYTPRQGSAPPETEWGRSLIIFKRNDDGRWRVHRDMDSPAPQPAAVGVSDPAGAPPAIRAAAAPIAPVEPRPWNPADRTAAVECDRLSASRYDRTRLAPPVAREQIDVPAAIRQCEDDLRRLPGDPRILFQLGRLYGYSGDAAKTLEVRRAAAAAGNHNAIFLLGFLDWSAAKEDVARCRAARDMKLAADRGNYSAQITYSALLLEGRFDRCPERASRPEIQAYLKAARAAVDGFFETRLADHLIWESGGSGLASRPAVRGAD